MAQRTTNQARFAIGVDYGTNSVRALIVDVLDGHEVATSVYDYPSGEDGILLDAKDPNLARQNPADYVQGFYRSIRGAITRAKKKPGFRADKVVGIGIDTTASTPIPVDRLGTPLALKPRFKRNLAAYAWLWKDHTAHAEAAEITDLARRSRDDYLAKCGGTYSSEWFWSKILRCQRTAPKVFNAAHSWVELADFVPAFATGRRAPDQIVRGICAAGHKAMYHQQWKGLPRDSFLRRLDPDLTRLRATFSMPAQSVDRSVGGLDAEVAAKIGLPPDTPIAVGAIDAHMGAVGAGIKPDTLVKIMGTSTCDMMVAPLEDKLPDIPGLCGIVPGSIIPGMYGLEAGQSAVGDIFNWFAGHLTPDEFMARGDAHVKLTQATRQVLPGESGLLSLDWNNGNRSVLVDPLLSGLLVGQTLHTNAPEVYRALIEATAFGALTIINRLEEYDVKVKEVVACGGIAEKNPVVMQIYADVCNRPMKVSGVSQTCALGSAICGAVVGGAYKTVQQAQKKMTGSTRETFRPSRTAARIYARLFRLYNTLHDAFGTSGGTTALDHVMKELVAIRAEVRDRKR